MAGNFTAQYGTANQALTITLGSLGNSDNFVARESTVVDNSSDLALDALVVVRVHVGTVAVNKCVVVRAYGTVDGSVYTSKATGSDAAYGTGNQCVGLLPIIGIIPTLTSSIKYESAPMSVASAFGGVLPQKWGIVVQNQSGAALDVTTVDNCAKYQLVSQSYT